MTALEDIYLPYRPKRRTRATIAREKRASSRWPTCSSRRQADDRPRWRRPPRSSTPSKERPRCGGRARRRARHHRRAGQRRRRRPRPAAAALLGPRQRPLRGRAAARRQTGPSSRTTSTGASRSRRCPAHRILAIRRGEAEGFLRVRVAPPEGEAQSPRWSRSSSRRQGARRRAGATGGAGRLQAAARAVDGDRDPARGEEEGRRRGDPRLRREPAPAPARLAARPEARAGHRPRLPHRLQGGRASTRQGKLLHNDVIYPTAASAAQAQQAGADRAGAVRALRASRPSPSATAPPAARPRRSSAASACRPDHRRRRWSTRAGASIYSASRRRARGVPGPGRHRARRGLASAAA